MLGLHLIADLYGCVESPLLSDAGRLRTLCTHLSEHVDLRVVGAHFHQFAGLPGEQSGGATGALVFAESHLAVHTWPERRAVTLDVYVCNLSADNSAKAERLCALLQAEFQPQSSDVKRVWRGRETESQSVTELREALNASSGAYFSTSAQICSHQSNVQLIELFETPDLGKVMRIDQVNMVAERDEFLYHEALVHPAATCHALPKRALIIGGGDGGATEELLKHRCIDHVDLCELDEAVVRLSKEHLSSVHHNVFDDPRLHLHFGDGLAYVAGHASNPRGHRYDLIYLDLTDPIGPAQALYQANFFSDCSRLLNDDGALTLHLGSPLAHRERIKQILTHLNQAFASVAPFFTNIPSYGGSWGFAIASNRANVASVPAPVLDERLRTRGVVDCQFYEGCVHASMFVTPRFLRELIPPRV